MIEVNISRQLRDYMLEVSFTLADSRCMALVGPTGCGKTTTLRIIAGLLSPDTGYVRMDGKTLVDAKTGVSIEPQRRHLGVVFQNYALFPHMTALQNVMYGIHEKSGREAKETAMNALQRLNLKGVELQRPSQLSGGQQQRVALARALASGANALLMDEPLSALDASTRRYVRTELRQTIEELGMQTIIVTHDPVDALTLGDVICVMHEGRVDQIGNRHELLEKPRSSFVAEFMGVNLLSGQADCDAEGLCRINCGTNTFLSTDNISGEALLTVNPWDVRLSQNQPVGIDTNVLCGKITSLVHLGPRTRVSVSNGVTLTAEISHRLETELNLNVGDEICACFEIAAARVYQ